MEIDPSTLPIAQRIGALTAHALILFLLAWLITKFLRAIAPNRQPPDFDERFLNLQRRLFLGNTPLGRYRTPAVELFFNVNIVAVWVLFFLQLGLLIVAAV